MGQQQSKDELLHQQVLNNNVEGIKALAREGAGVEWTDSEGKTPLIVACLFPDFVDVARTLIELGANVNAYRPGRHAGTPLHHAAKNGCEQIVQLLVSHGANALLMNDDFQTPLDVARAKGHSKVVRAIENHICLFSGWMREFHGPGFLEVIAPQWVSRKVWVVILPCGSRKPTKPFKLELAIYSSLQDAQPLFTIALWKANLDEPNFQDPDPAVIILDNTSISRGRRRRRRTYTSQEARRRPRALRQNRIKLGPEKKGDREQLQWFCNACKGIPQAMRPPAFLQNAQTPAVPPSAPSGAEDLELAMAINESIQSAMEERPPPFDSPSGFESGASTSWNNPVNITNLNFPDTSVAPVAPASSKSSHSECVHVAGPSTITTEQISSISAPPIADEVIDYGPVHYPSIDFSPVDLTSPAFETSAAASEQSKEGGSASEQSKEGDAASSCVICLDASVEGACIPCGHMAGCMSCLNDIKAKKWGCPVCRAKIDQVVKLYSV